MADPASNRRPVICFIRQDTTSKRTAPLTKGMRGAKNMLCDCLRWEGKSHQADIREPNAMRSTQAGAIKQTYESQTLCVRLRWEGKSHPADRREPNAMRLTQPCLKKTVCQTLCI